MRLTHMFLLGMLGAVMLAAGCESAPATADAARQTAPAKRGDSNHRHVPRHHRCMQHDHH